MRRCPLHYIEIEALLLSIRNKVLTERNFIEWKSGTIRFVEALAIQCFTNEYAYYVDAVEKKEFASLERIVRQTLSDGSMPTEIEIVCLACYRPLYEYEWSPSSGFPESLRSLWERQISDVVRERLLKSEIPVLPGGGDEISRRVQTQYEQNPYPRWIDISIPEKVTTFAEYLENQSLKIPFLPILNKQLKDVLIAGCGTGQQVLELAYRYSDARF